MQEQNTHDDNQLEQWRLTFADEDYVDGDYGWEDYAPAYRLGAQSRWHAEGKTWDRCESMLCAEWERARGESRLSWNAAKPAVRAAWEQQRAHA